jgi:GWxTD domain-containing protein
VRLLLTEKEVSLASRMVSDEQQAEFRSWFWIRRDPDPETPRNEFREEFHYRVAHVDQLFGDRRAGELGWMTTPGAIQLILGDPANVRRVPKGVFAQGAYRDLMVWDYGSSAPGGALSVQFVSTSKGLAIVNDPRTGALPDSLTRALARAVRNTVRDPDLPLGEIPTDNRISDTLPMHGSVHLESGALEADVSISLSDLRGRAEDDHLVVELEVGLSDVLATAESVRSISVIDFRISAEQFGRWSKRKLHVVLSLPAGSFDPARVGAVRVTEHPTGRCAMMTVARRESGSLARRAVGHVLAIDRKIAHGGIVAAFIEGDETSTNPGSLALPGAPIRRRQ